MVVNGAGASAIACTNLLKKTGVPSKNIIMIDSRGVIYKGRENLNKWKVVHAIDTKKRTLEDAIEGADVFLGLSSKSILSKKMVKKMSINPIIFACANPDPEITPEEVEEVLKRHSAVFDALVVGLPDEQFGQRVVAVVSCDAGQILEEGDLLAFAKEHLAGYKVPKRTFFVAEVRRAPNGKADYKWAKQHAESQA